MTLAFSWSYDFDVPVVLNKTPSCQKIREHKVTVGLRVLHAKYVPSRTTFFFVFLQVNAHEVRVEQQIINVLFFVNRLGQRITRVVNEVRLSEATRAQNLFKGVVRVRVRQFA